MAGGATIAENILAIIDRISDEFDKREMEEYIKDLETGLIKAQADNDKYIVIINNLKNRGD